MVMHPEISLMKGRFFRCVGVPGTIREYIAFSFDSMDKDKLSADILSVCSLLNKGLYIVACPDFLPIFDHLNNTAEKIGARNGDTFFLVDNLNFISRMNLIGTRRLTIYNLSADNYDRFKLGMIAKNASYIVIIENYLEICDIYIKKADYREEVLQGLSGTGCRTVDGSVSQSDSKSDKR